jgi:hypothetical protein
MEKNMAPQQSISNPLEVRDQNVDLGSADTAKSFGEERAVIRGFVSRDIAALAQFALPSLSSETGDLLVYSCRVRADWARRRLGGARIDRLKRAADASSRCRAP